MDQARNGSVEILNRFVLFAAWLLTIQSALAADDFWSNPSGGLFNVGANWSDGSVPAVGDDAYFGLPDTYIVQWTPAVGNTVNRRLYIPAGNVTFLATGGNFKHTLDDPGPFGNFGGAQLDGGKLVLGALSGSSFLLEANSLIQLNNSSMELGFGSRLKTQSFAMGNTTDGTQTYSSVSVRDGADIETSDVFMGRYENSYTYMRIEGVGTAVTTAHLSLGQALIDIRNGGTLTSTSTASLGTTLPRLASIYVQGDTIPTTWNANDIYMGGVSLDGRPGFGFLGINNNGFVTANSITVNAGSTVQLINGTLTTSNLNLVGGRLSLFAFGENQVATVNVTNPFGMLRLTPERLQSSSLFLNANQQLHVAGTTLIETGAEIDVYDSNGFSSSRLINHGRLHVVSDLTIGDISKHGAYSGSGELIVDGNLTIHDAGFADLGYLTEIYSGSIDAPNGIALPAGGDLVVGGFITAVNGKLSTAAGSSVVAESGLKSLGDLFSLAGISIGGELHVNDSSLLLYDANLAELGTLTSLGRDSGTGVLQPINGAIIDFADNIVGHGLIATPNDSHKPMIVNGQASGNSLAEQLTFLGYVKGVGTFNNVTFEGTHSPGLSIATLNVGDVTYSDTSTLIIELGGSSPNVGFDRIDSSGTLQLDGTLQIDLRASVNLTLGQSFEIMSADDAIFGAFDSLLLPAISGGLALDVQYTTNSVMLQVVSAAGGDFNFDGIVDAADYVTWRKNGGTSAGYATWRTNFGATLSGGGSGSPTAEAGSNVSEPNALVLVLAGVAALARFRKQALQSGVKAWLSSK